MIVRHFQADRARLKVCAGLPLPDDRDSFAAYLSRRAFLEMRLPIIIGWRSSRVKCGWIGRKGNGT